MNRLACRLPASVPICSFPVAAACAWGAALLGLTAIGLAIGGVFYWLQGSIFLLAGIPLAIGITGILQHRWFGNERARRRGLVFVFVAWALIVHGWTSINSHRAAVVERETELAPLIDSLERYHAQFGAYPPTLSDLATVEAGAATRPAHIYYTAFSDKNYLLSFNHNIVISHRYLPTERRWIDVL